MIRQNIGMHPGTNQVPLWGRLLRIMVLSDKFWVSIFNESKVAANWL